MVAKGTYAANPATLPRGTLVQLFFNAVERFDKPDALRWRAPDGWRSLSHREVLARVRALALALEELGVRRGDRVAILSENRPEWAIADYASLCLGSFDVPVYATLPANQITYILNNSGASVIFVSSTDQLEKVQSIAHELRALQHVIVFDDVAARDARVHTLARVLERGRALEAAGQGADFKTRALQAQPDDLATVLYTSGTTGTPKGVMLTHNNIFSNVQAVRSVLPAGPEDVALSFLPLSHIFERTVDYKLFGVGVTIAYVPAFELVAQSMVEVRPTIVAAAPRVYEKVYAKVMSATGIKRVLVHWAARVGRRWADAKLAGREPDTLTRAQHALADRLVFRKVRAAVGGRMRYFISGSAPLNPEIARFFYGAGLTILEGYGLTETSPVTNVNLPHKIKLGTVGPPVPGTEIKIAADGEILIRGPQVMKGYYNLPDATREAIDPEGWFHTGDIGELDEDGYLRITDRKKELLKTAGGKFIAPQPVENRVKMSPLVAEAVLIGDRRPYAVLLIVPNYAALEAWAAQNGIAVSSRTELIRDERVHKQVEESVFGTLQGLARFEMPKKIGLLEHEFSVERGELTPSLKVKRRVIDERYRHVIDSLYAGVEQVA